MISVTDNKYQIKGFNVFILEKACSQRQLDAKKIETYLIENNYKIVNHPKFADIIIFVTCAFRNAMAEKALNKIKDLQRYNAELIVAGCLPGIDKEELSKVFKGKVIITKDLNKIDSLFPKNLKKFKDLDDENVFFHGIDPSNIRGNIRTRITFIDNFYSNIKKNVYKIIFGEDSIVYRNSVEDSAYRIRISWGCNANCAYCAIKKSVGPYHSKAFDQCIKEFQKGLKEGYKKFYIAGDNVSFYGVDIGSSLIELLDEITNTSGDYQLYIENLNSEWVTNHVDDFEKILKRNKIRNICVAIQSGSHNVLKLMNRYSNIEKMKEVLSRLRKNHPEIIFNSLYIIGFPAETEEDLHDTLSFIKTIDFTDGIIYPFSLRTGTKAEEIEPKIHNETIFDRMDYAKKYLRSMGYKVIFNPKSIFLFYKKND